MQSRIAILITITVLSCSWESAAAESVKLVWPHFQKSRWFDEQISYVEIEPEVRLLIVSPLPSKIRSGVPNRIVLFTTPNGSTIEQTLGCQKQAGQDWRFDIQQIAAQHRTWQNLNQRENLILVCLEARGLSWPRWRAKHANNPILIRTVISEILKAVPLQDVKLTLACHSGGGSFLWGFLNGSKTIPDQVDRFVFLDANYSFDVADRHGEKFLDWLKSDKSRTLVVISYDDRNVIFRGKKVISPTGGTYRATYRMRDRFQQDLKMEETKQEEFLSLSGLEGQIKMLIHTNPKNQILHTRLVGEMNGYLYGMTVNTPEGARFTLPRGPRAYLKWIQPDSFEPTKANDN